MHRGSALLDVGELLRVTRITALLYVAQKVRGPAAPTYPANERDRRHLESLRGLADVARSQESDDAICRFLEICERHDVAQYGLPHARCQVHAGYAQRRGRLLKVIVEQRIEFPH